MTLSPKLVAAVLAFVPALSFSQGNTVNDSFNKAKQLLEKEVYFDHRVTLYCAANLTRGKILRYRPALLLKSIKSEQAGWNGNM